MNFLNMKLWIKWTSNKSATRLKLYLMFYELYADNDGNINHKSRLSYWRESYGLLNIDITESESNYFGIDKYWWEVYLSVTSEANLSLFHVYEV